MSQIKRFTQHLGSLILPSTATIFFIGLAVYENGFVRVFTHVFRNVMILTPRIPHVFRQIWNERQTIFTVNNWACNLVYLTIGMPFILLFILLDDYEE